MLPTLRIPKSPRLGTHPTLDRQSTATRCTLGCLRFRDCLASPPPMVKFGETIQEGKKPEWVEGYVDYDGLKKLLERMEAAGTTRE